MTEKRNGKSLENYWKMTEKNKETRIPRHHGTPIEGSLKPGKLLWDSLHGTTYEIRQYEPGQYEPR